MSHTPDLPETMRAWRVHQWGENPTETLQLDTIPLPTPEAGELLVRVEALPLNLNDMERVNGKNMMVRPELPVTPGMEVMGVVAAGGAGGEDQVGRRVVAMPKQAVGGFAEYAICPVVEAQEALEHDSEIARRRRGQPPHDRVADVGVAMRVEIEGDLRVDGPLAVEVLGRDIGRLVVDPPLGDPGYTCPVLDRVGTGIHRRLGHDVAPERVTRRRERLLDPGARVEGQEPALEDGGRGIKGAHDPRRTTSPDFLGFVRHLDRHTPAPARPRPSPPPEADPNPVAIVRTDRAPLRYHPVRPASDP
jgi:hypothetical protein